MGSPGTMAQGPEQLEAAFKRLFKMWRWHFNRTCTVAVSQSEYLRYALSRLLWKIGHPSTFQGNWCPISALLWSPCGLVRWCIWHIRDYCRSLFTTFSSRCQSCLWCSVSTGDECGRHYDSWGGAQSSRFPGMQRLPRLFSLRMEEFLEALKSFMVGKNGHKNVSMLVYVAWICGYGQFILSYQDPWMVWLFLRAATILLGV